MKGASAQGASRHLSPFSGAGDTQSFPCPCLCPRLFGEHVWLWKISRRVELEFWILIPSCSVRHAGRIVSLENVFTIAAVFYQTQVLSLSCLVRHEVIPSATFLWDLTDVTLVCEDGTFKGRSFFVVTESDRWQTWMCQCCNMDLLKLLHSFVTVVYVFLNLLKMNWCIVNTKIDTGTYRKMSILLRNMWAFHLTLNVYEFLF